MTRLRIDAQPQPASMLSLTCWLLLGYPAASSAACSSCMAERHLHTLVNDLAAQARATIEILRFRHDSHQVQ